MCVSLWRVGGNEQVAVGSRLLGSLLSWYSHLGVLHRFALTSFYLLFVCVCVFVFFFLVSFG